MFRYSSLGLKNKIGILISVIVIGLISLFLYYYISNQSSSQPNTPKQAENPQTATSPPPIPVVAYGTKSETKKSGLVDNVSGNFVKVDGNLYLLTQNPKVTIVNQSSGAQSAGGVSDIKAGDKVEISRSQESLSDFDQVKIFRTK